MPALPPYLIDAPTTFVIGASGRLVDPFRLEAVVYDVSDAAKRSIPVQVLPVPPGGKFDVLTGGVRLAAGYYKLPYAPAPGEVRGRRIVRWFLELEDGSGEVTWDTDWEVLDAPALPRTGPAYALVSDLRDEGYTPAALSDVRAQLLIARASAMVERFTGRVFAPVYKRVSVDGRGGHMVQVGEPIIALDSVTIADDAFAGIGSSTVSDLLRVYNRHISENLRDPDDREDPRISFYRVDGMRPDVSYGSRLTFPSGQRNVHLEGVFGYTDFDGSPTGRTPALIRHATMLIVAREFGTIGGAGGRPGIGAWRVTKEKTRDQEVAYSGATSAGVKVGSPLLGAFTGDPEIDMLLATYTRPPKLGAA